MNTTQLITLSLVAFASTAALADDITIDRSPFVSVTTRADVKAEVLQARTQGTLLAAGEASRKEAPVQVATSREAVRAEVRTANRTHTLLAAGELLTPNRSVRMN
ncbi:DUF4148 domain-containing protein [Ideonella sp. A 288]|uniref:DUF4148 domain-containing protein n=1 Tax=Ideonella sp. A 288 TaxID=1962181 RepID=UPI001303BAE9|nr:DUF4148 domain-containing protein [Ideonella sp. A 288]